MAGNASMLAARFGLLLLSMLLWCAGETGAQAQTTASVPVHTANFPAVQGISIRSGESFTIAASGSACYARGNRCDGAAGPQGSGTGNGSAQAKLPGAPKHGLVCGVGGQTASDLFFVGTGTTRTANRSGSLYCGMNEDPGLESSYFDNDGTWSIVVTVGTPGGAAVTLTVTTSGAGSVTSTPAGLNSCSGSCSASFSSGTRVTLAANADFGSRFTGWGGACGGSSATCDLVLNGSTSVTASFSGSGRAPTLSVTPERITRAGSSTLEVSATVQGGRNAILREQMTKDGVVIGFSLLGLLQFNGDHGTGRVNLSLGPESNGAYEWSLITSAGTATARFTVAVGSSGGAGNPYGTSGNNLRVVQLRVGVQQSLGPFQLGSPLNTRLLLIEVPQSGTLRAWRLPSDVHLYLFDVSGALPGLKGGFMNDYVNPTLELEDGVFVAGPGTYLLAIEQGGFTDLRDTFYVQVILDR